MTGAAILISFGADLVFGDPRSGHPVALFGALALRVERLVPNKRARNGSKVGRSSGTSAQ
ncbi:MAG: hypothetical protein M3P50_00515 [Actinomycetota bacterium]|nr:hypothetical protein [Actinomycetota bacterium]